MPFYGAMNNNCHRYNKRPRSGKGIPECLVKTSISASKLSRENHNYAYAHQLHCPHAIVAVRTVHGYIQLR